MLVSVPVERRRVVDRRRGAERRSTIDRREHSPRNGNLESPSEHLRNALQLLNARGVEGGPFLKRADFDAAIDRIERALKVLEPR